MNKHSLWFTSLSLLLFIGILAAAAAPLPPGLGPRTDTIRVSVSTGGAQGNEDSSRPAISNDGTIIAFESTSNTLVANDNNNKSDIFVHNLNTGVTSRVSINGGGVEGNGDSYNPAVSGDGRYVTFHSLATNLAAADTNNAADIFVYDRNTGLIWRVSVNSGGTQGNAPSYDPDISYDGRYVTFWSLASNLITIDSNGRSDVFVHDRNTGQTWRVSVSSGGIAGDDDSSKPSISDDGKKVAFESYAANLVGNDLNNLKDIFVHDWQALSTVRVSVHSNGQESNGDSYDADIAGSGGRVSFTSLATNLINSDGNQAADIFVRDLGANSTVRVSRRSDGGEANNSSSNSAMAPGGNYVVFRSTASNLVNGDTNTLADIFFYDLGANTVERVSVTSSGGQANDASHYPAVGLSGNLVIFRSKATNLVGNDTNNRRDIFVRDRTTVPPTPPAVLTGDHDSGAPGSYFAFDGSEFLNSSSADIVVNGVDVGSVNTDANGDIAFNLCTNGGAAIGAYFVTASAGPTAATAPFRLDNADPTWPNPNNGAPTFCIPDNIAYTEARYLPFVGTGP